MLTLTLKILACALEQTDHFNDYPCSFLLESCLKLSIFFIKLSLLRSQQENWYMISYWLRTSSASGWELSANCCMSLLRKQMQLVRQMMGTAKGITPARRVCERTAQQMLVREGTTMSATAALNVDAKCYVKKCREYTTISSFSAFCLSQYERMNAWISLFRQAYSFSLSKEGRCFQGG